MHQQESTLSPRDLVVREDWVQKELQFRRRPGSPWGRNGAFYRQYDGDKLLLGQFGVSLRDPSLSSKETSSLILEISSDTSELSCNSFFVVSFKNI